MLTKSNLVIQTAFLGDLILSIPNLKRIKEIFPQDKLIIVCKQGLGEFLIAEKIVDAVIEVEKSNRESYKLALEEVKKNDIKNIFCLHRSLRSMIFVSKIKAEKKIGFSSFLGYWIFDETVAYVKEYPEVIRQFGLLQVVDKKTYQEINSKDYSYLNDSSLPKVPDFFSFSKKNPSQVSQNKIAIFPGSVWATKKWTTSGYTQLCQLLIKDGFEVDLMGGPPEKSLCVEIAEMAKGVKVRAGSLSIAETIAALSGYSLVISNDSASTHMAAYDNIPVLTIFGPTTLNQGFRPWIDKAAVVQNNNLKCRPCGAHGHNKCPLEHHNCMKDIDVIEVFKAAKRIITS
ncbi:MAG: glycosyltransferase family 9 protein [Bdellovibrionota bacterium]